MKPPSTTPGASGQSTAWAAEKLQAFLEEAFPGATVHVRDDTALHLDHNAEVGHHGGHYRITMVWAGFGGKGRLACHKQVMHALAPVWKGKHIHALTLKLRSAEAHKA